MRYSKIEKDKLSIEIPIPESYSDCITLIRSDYYRYKGVNSSILKMWLYGFRNKGFRYSFWLRLSAYKGIFFYFTRFCLWRLSQKYALEISPKSKIGYGLYIGHGIGTIVNPTAVIGNNVNLSQFTTIGSNSGKAAIIGNNVYIGPSVCIVSDLIIANNSTIGAGSVITKDVPENATVVGVPGKIISYDNSGQFVIRRWSYK